MAIGGGNSLECDPPLESESSDTRRQETSPNDPRLAVNPPSEFVADLARIVVTWPDLPEHIRAAVSQRKRPLPSLARSPLPSSGGERSADPRAGEGDKKQSYSLTSSQRSKHHGGGEDRAALARQRASRGPTAGIRAVFQLKGGGVARQA